MCKCQEKKGAITPLETKQAVLCIDCSDALPDLKGKLRPVHKVPVLASQEQIAQWRDDGHDIQELWV